MQQDGFGRVGQLHTSLVYKHDRMRWDKTIGKWEGPTFASVQETRYTSAPTNICSSFASLPGGLKCQTIKCCIIILIQINFTVVKVFQP